MSKQFYEPPVDTLIACDDGKHFILLEEGNDFCNWVMRRHPDGPLYSIRKATHHELAHARARQHLRRGAATLAAATVLPTVDQAEEYTYASKQSTSCAGCGVRKHTPLRVDEMGGYVCLTCIDKKLSDLFETKRAPESQLPTMADLNLQVFEELQQAQARIEAALALLRDDGYAATFQTLGQYRASLIKTLAQA